jgi:hypothetical protein
MMASVNFLTVMVTLALGITMLAPVIFIVLWIKEWKEGRLW